MTAGKYQKQAAYRKRQAERGFIFLQVWARPHEAELIRGMLKGWRAAEATKASKRDAA